MVKGGGRQGGVGRQGEREEEERKNKKERPFSRSFKAHILV